MTVRQNPCIECGTPRFYARGRCQTCYGRWRRQQKRAGSFSLLIVHGAPLRKLTERAEPGSDGCVLYTGYITDGGYGQISVNGSQKLAHRAIYELTVGPIPEGMELDHICHNRDSSCVGGTSCRHRRCINVDHLEPVTGAENTRRGRTWAINGTKTHCPQGHPYDDENTHRYGGRRYCRACNREVGRRSKQERAA
ncbi:HNH endonuclease signature motif containing protein [Streptomyces sp. NBC_01353]|uniref:HNH endonuclease signature motif containing protein n=1 Tax=Streptomyces sp. NBC_01353 TaxID=2903835 RepID=UPI002E344B28|nr:HNH endonuclease signature motif containing protein [Streptomyces sp. NBC_01353]